MVGVSFITLVHKHFNFLVKEFGYIINQEHQLNDRYDSGYVEFKSSTAVIRVEKDGQNILISIKPLNEPEISKQYFETILDSKQVKYENQFPFGVSPSNYDRALGIYARLLREKCNNLLRGDFFEWLEILKHFVEKRKKDYFSWSGKELPPGTLQELEDYIKSKSSA